MKTIKENTLKLELLEVISREKKELIKIVLCQPKKKDNIEKTQHVLETFCKGKKKQQTSVSKYLYLYFILKVNVTFFPI